MRTHLRRLFTRFDGPASFTASGQMEAPANLTRTGVFVYAAYDENGAPIEIREYRPPEEVFHEDSISTLRGAPVVEGHPAFIDATNWKTFAVGHAADDVRASAPFVAGTLRISDGRVQADLNATRLSEISLGYLCDIDPTPGTSPEGEPYDVVQRGIRYNHVGLGPANWGRAGSDVRVYLDSAESPLGVSHYDSNMMRTLRQFRTDSARAPVAPTAPAPGGSGAPTTPAATPAPTTPTAPRNDAPAPLAPLTLAVDVVALATQNERLTAEKAGLEAELAALRAPIAAVNEQATLDARVAELATLREEATAVGVNPERTDSARVIRTKVLGAIAPNSRLDSNTTDSALRLAYDAALAGFRRGGGTAAGAGLTDAVDAAVRADGLEAVSPVDAARARQDARIYGTRRAFGEAPAAPAPAAKK